MFHILVADDELALRSALRTSLTASGYALDEARNGEEAIAAMRRQPADLVLLDINMPGMDGVETCRRIRVLSPKSGILMITVRDAEDDKVRALEAGADDYVTKPFRFRELLARMRAVLRRTQAAEREEAPILVAGKLEMDVERRILRKAGEQIHLSPTEFDLLAYLMRHRDVPLPHAKLLRAVWGPDYGNELEYLRAYIRLLRKKIEDHAAEPKYILTEPWVGYRFRDPAEQERTELGGP